MSDSKNVSVSVGPGAFGLLTILFAFAKIKGYIDWSWWLVLAPMWVPFTLVIAFFVFIFIVAVLVQE